MRASTGYAFIDTLTHAEQLAGSLLTALKTQTLHSWQPDAFQRGAIEKWMDFVFLDVLKSDWERAPGYFMQLFNAVPVDDTVAFLTGHATWQQRLRVMRSLPVIPFAEAAMRGSSLGRWTGKPRHARADSK